jgi:hypothetical protein
MGVSLLINLVLLAFFLNIFAFRDNSKRYVIQAGLALMLVLLDIMYHNLIFAGMWTLMILIQAWYFQRATS